MIHSRKGGPPGPPFAFSAARSTMSALAPIVAVVAVLIGGLSLGAPLGNDYASPRCAAMQCNDAAPAIEALANLDLREFAATQPAMGVLSLAARAPLAAASEALGGGSLADYRLGVALCLLAAGALGFWLASRLSGRASPAALVAVAALLVVNPFTLSAIEYGHPEEILMAVLAVGAGVAALRGHGVLAGVLLGLAVGTKLTAALAVLPVILAAVPAQRLRLAAIAGVIGALLILPPALLDREHFGATTQTVTQTSPVVSPFNIWWPMSEARMIVVGSDGGKPILEEANVVPAWIGRINRLLIFGAAAVLSLLFALRRRLRPGAPALALLALVMLLRCVLDPIDNSYYHLSALFAVAAWETLGRGRMPVVALAAAAAAASMHLMPTLDLKNLLYLGWTLALAAYLAWEAFRRPPAPADAGLSRARRSDQSATAPPLAARPVAPAPAVAGANSATIAQGTIHGR